MSYVEQQIQNQLESSMNEYKEMNKQIQQLQEENKLLRECVEYYACASMNNYLVINMNEKARKTIAKIKGDKNE